jgi:DNA-binding winged helix-turn-helix (wHTH) protein
MLQEIGRMLRNDRRHDIHRFGSLSVDIGSGEVKRNGHLVSLTNLEFKLLRHLIERIGSSVSREELLRSVWGYNSGALTRTVDMHVHDLRRKIEHDAKRPELIITVKGEGYKFVARVGIPHDPVVVCFQPCACIVCFYGSEPSTEAPPKIRKSWVSSSPNVSENCYRRTKVSWPRQPAPSPIRRMKTTVPSQPSLTSQRNPAGGTLPR